jgi:hypothetical protein
MSENICSQLKNDFDARKREIEQYLEFLNKLESFYVKKRRFANLPKKTKAVRYKKIELDSDLEQILLSNTFLLIYNLVESTLLNAIEHIASTVKERKIPFCELNEAVQGILLNKVQGLEKKGVLKEEIVKKVLVADIVQHVTIKINTKHTLTHKEILKFINQYHIKIDKFTRSRNLEEEKASVAKIADNRNKLAHGNVSFATLGKNITLQDLRRDYDHVCRYLSRLLHDVSVFVESEGYLALAR